jgi:hypothetical protein
LRLVASVELEIHGLKIARAYRNASQVEVEFEDAGEVGFTLEGEYWIKRPGQESRMAPSTDDERRVRECFEPLLGVPVDRAFARETGELVVRFVGGASLECGPGDMYEPWSHYGPNRLRVWSLPGGGRISVGEAP